MKFLATPFLHGLQSAFDCGGRMAGLVRRVPLMGLFLLGVGVTRPGEALADVSPAARTSSGLDSAVVRVATTGAEIFTVSTHEPAAVPGRPQALLLAFHGGENHQDPGNGAERIYRDQLKELLEKAGLADHFIVVAPHSPGRGWRWDAPRFEVQTKLRTLTEWAFNRYSIDPRRVYYTGRSNGGASSGPITLGQPGLFAALFPWTGAPEGGLDGIDPATAPDWYVVASGGEVPVWANDIISHVHKLESRGLHVVYREPQGFTHSSVHQREDIYADGFKWFTALRNKAVPPPAAAQRLLDELAARSSFRLTAKEIEALEEIGGVEAGRVIRLALRSADAALRRAGAASCARLIYGAEVWEELVALAADADAEVRLKVIEAFGVHARWRYFDALERLSAIALARTNAGADRLAAIQALDFAVRLDAAHGLALDYPQRELNLRPTRALWTWIQLLDDDAIELRHASANALDRYYPGNTFGYAAGLDAPARRLAARQWEEWGLRALGEKYRPGSRSPGGAARNYTLTVWSRPINGRVYLGNQLIGLAPASIGIEGTADRRFLAPTRITIDALSPDPAAAFRLTERWFGAGDLIPTDISGDVVVTY